MRTRAALGIVFAIAATAAMAAACDQGGSPPAAPAPAAAAPPPPPAAPPPPPPPPAAIVGLTTPYASEAEWSTACAEQKINKGVCDCAAKATVKEIGAQALFSWVWEGYIQRVGMGKVRSDKWFKDNGKDTAAQQKFADAVGKCYVTQ